MTRQPPNARHRVAVIISIVALAVFLLASAVQAGGDGAVATVDYRVRSGDTLWSIAEDHDGDGGDVRATVHQIRGLNGLDGSTIYSGQILLLPAG
jgi:LysM repeat protein